MAKTDKVNLLRFAWYRTRQTMQFGLVAQLVRVTDS